jgi:hypothetical protein
MAHQCNDKVLERVEDHRIVSALSNSYVSLTFFSRALMTFLGDRVPDTVRDKNRRGMMQFLLELTKRNAPSTQETLIIAYGQAARFVEDLFGEAAFANSL